MFGMGPWELIFICLVILLLFGAKRIPEVAQGLGKGIREFKKAMRDVSDDVKGSPDVTPPTNRPTDHEQKAGH